MLNENDQLLMSLKRRPPKTSTTVHDGSSVVLNLQNFRRWFWNFGGGNHFLSSFAMFGWWFSLEVKCFRTFSFKLLSSSFLLLLIQVLLHQKSEQTSTTTQLNTWSFRFAIKANWLEFVGRKCELGCKQTDTHSLLLASRLRLRISSRVMLLCCSQSPFSCSKALRRSSNSRIWSSRA